MAGRPAGGRRRSWTPALPFPSSPRPSPRCGGRLRLIATAEDPRVAGKILAHLRLLHPADSPGPAPPSADLRAAVPSHQ